MKLLCASEMFMQAFIKTLHLSSYWTRVSGMKQMSLETERGDWQQIAVHEIVFLHMKCKVELRFIIRTTRAEKFPCCTLLTLILLRSCTGTVWFYTSTSNKRAARPKQYTKSLTRDLKCMYSRLTLVRISINL